MTCPGDDLQSEGSRDLGTTYNRTYAYDLDSNRVERRTGPPESEVAYTTTFDRTDVAIATAKDGGTAVATSYDRYGNLLADGSGGDADGVVAYAYDLADRTIAITPQGATGPTELGLDALGRVATRTTGASTDTLSYLGSTNAVVRIANAGGSGTTTDSLLDAAGSRLGTKVGSADPAWLLPDLHGNTAGAFDAAGGAIVDALRYDGYGLTLAAWNATSNSTPNRDWKYQGRLDLSPDAADDDVASAQPLYDFGAREYSPSAGAFTSLDSVLGSAQAPWQLNRYLYAAANPATLVDPDGHATCWWGPERLPTASWSPGWRHAPTGISRRPRQGPVGSIPEVRAWRIPLRM